MAYSALADLQKYLDSAAIVALADDNGDGVADAATITEAIAAADAEIDSWIGAQYAVFSGTAPAIVRALSSKLAIYYLYMRRPEAALPEKWATEIENVRKMLQAIANGTLQLGAACSSNESGDGVETARAEDESHFNEDSLGRF